MYKFQRKSIHLDEIVLDPRIIFSNIIPQMWIHILRNKYYRNRWLSQLTYLTWLLRT